MKNGLGILSLGNSCVGCGSCIAVCGHKAISFENLAGFNYPVLDKDTCIGCRKCELVCPVLVSEDNLITPFIDAFWAFAKVPSITTKASSGGIFPLLAYKTLEENGVVYGAAFSKDFTKVEHVRAVDESELDELFCSKYVQSEINPNIYQMIVADLQDARKVLFSGTGCQIAAIVSFLSCQKVKQDNLLLVEVICGGAPSPVLWKKWITSKGMLTRVNMRDKTNGWEEFSVLYEGTHSKKVVSIHDDWYMRAFLARATQRPSCFSCPSRGKFESDLVIGDYWRVFLEHPEVDRSRGVSAVLIVTDRGMGVFEQIQKHVKYGQSSVNKIEHGNHCLFSSPDKAECHDGLLADVEHLSIEALTKKYPISEPFKLRLRRSFGKAARKLLTVY